MEQKKFSKTMFVLVVVAIVVSIIGTFLFLNAISLDEEPETRDNSSGLISLSIAGEPREYVSSGQISLNIVNDLEE